MKRIIHTITIKLYSDNSKLFTDQIGNRIAKTIEKDKLLMRNFERVVVNWKNNLE